MPNTYNYETGEEISTDRSDIDIQPLPGVGTGKTLLEQSQNNRYYSPQITPITGSGGRGFMGMGSAVGAAIGSVVPGVGTAIGAGAGALAGGIVDWIMANDAANKQAAENERIYRIQMKQRNEDIARSEKWNTLEYNMRKQQLADEEAYNEYKMNNEESDRKMNAGFRMVGILNNMMQTNDNWRTHLLNVRRAA